jgi:Caspase domain/NHL repeat
LEFCKKDGEEMYQLLKSLGYQITDNHKLVGQVNYEKMRDAIIDFFTDVNTKSEDILLFYFSGHGIPDALGDMYLTSSDIDSDAPFRRGFSFGDLTEMIQRSTSTRIVIILDCCYSGSAKLSLGSEDAATVLGTAAIRDKTRFLKESEGKYLLAASQAAQEAYALSEGDHSIFTYYLLKGLKGSKRAIDAEGNVTPLSLGTYIFRQIVNLPPERKPKQKPIVKVEAAGDIVLAQYPKSTVVKKPKGEEEEAAAKTEQEEGRVSNVIQPTTTATPESSSPKVQSPSSKLPSELITASTTKTTKDTAPVVQDARETEAVAAASPPDLEKPTQEIQQEQPSSPSVLPSQTASPSIEEETARSSSSEVAISPSSSSPPAKSPLRFVGSPLSSLTTTKEDNGTGIAAALHEQETKEAKSVQTEPSQGMPPPIDQGRDNGIVEEERKGGPPQIGSKPISSADAPYMGEEVGRKEPTNTIKEEYQPRGKKRWVWMIIAGGAVGVILLSMFGTGLLSIPPPSETTTTPPPSETTNPEQQHYSFFEAWGTPGTGNGQFNGTSDVAVDSQGYVYVADDGNNRIQKFDSDGAFVTSWGTPGTGNGEFDGPVSVAVDSQGYVYVADYFNNRIQIWAPSTS